MDLTKVKISENDSVALTQKMGKWPAGTEGAVVSDHGADKLIEIVGDRGQDLDMFIVPEERLRLIKHYPPKLPPDA
jgi:hypothetical protein